MRLFLWSFVASDLLIPDDIGFHILPVNSPSSCCDFVCMLDRADIIVIINKLVTDNVRTIPQM